MSDAVLRGRGHPRLHLRSLIAGFSVCSIRIQKCYASTAANNNTYIFGRLSKRGRTQRLRSILLLAWSVAVITLFVCQTGVEDPLGFGLAYGRSFTRMFDSCEGMQHVSIPEPSQPNLRDTALHWHVRRAFELLTGFATFCGVARARKPGPSQVDCFRDHWQNWP